MKKTLAEYRYELRSNSSPDMIKEDAREIEKMKNILGKIDKSEDPTIGAGMGMEQLMEKFPAYTPDYVLDEVEYYYQKILNGKSDVFTLDNAISLVNLAFVCKRINKEQANEIKLIIKNIKDTY